MTAYGTVESAVEATREGAADSWRSRSSGV